MKKIFTLDGLVSVLLGLGLILSFFIPEQKFPRFMNCTYILLGTIGLIYVMFALRLFFNKKKLDWILVKENFLIKVINITLLIPFTLVMLFVFSERNKAKTTSNVELQNGLAKKLAFSENIYDQKKDTIELDTTEYISIGKIAKMMEYEIDTIIDGKYVLYKYKDVLPQEDPTKKGEEPSAFWSVYYHYIDPGNQHIASTESGRRWAAVIAICGYVFLNGLLVAVLIGWFDRRREQWIKGQVRYRYLRKTAVVIGANDMAPTIIKNLINGNGKSKIKYVVLLTNYDAEKVRYELESYLSNGDSRKLIIYNGQLDSIEEIYKLEIKRASEIYVLGENNCEDMSMSYHDTQNMKCVHNIASYLTDKCVSRRIECKVLFEYQTMYSVFQFSDLPNNVKEHLDFIPFNSYENWAHRVLVNGKYVENVKRILPMLTKLDIKQSAINKMLFKSTSYIQSIIPKNNDDNRVIDYLPLDGNGITSESKNYVHLIIVGMSKMGVALAIQAAQLAHYPNFKNNNSPRTRITFIDDNADKEMNYFMGNHRTLFNLSRWRYFDASQEICDEIQSEKVLTEAKWIDNMLRPGKGYEYFNDNFIDLEWEFIKGSVEQPIVTRYLEISANNAKPNNDEGNSILTMAVCLPLAHEALAASIYMPLSVYDYAQQILVYQRESSEIIYNLYSKDSNKDNQNYKKYSKLRPFGMQYQDFSMDMEYKYIAMLMNYVYSLIFNGNIDNSKINEIIAGIKDVNSSMIMQEVIEEWNKLPIFNKWSNMYLANSIGTKLRSIKCNYTDYNLHYDIICQKIDEFCKELDRTEHNRWNVQQLLMGFRPYKKGEYDYLNSLPKKSNIEECGETQKTYRDKMKKNQEKAHLDIRSYEDLKIIDPNVIEYDTLINKAIPEILRILQNSNSKS